MTTQNWPDPKRPGVPMFPERDGWHLLRVFGGTTIEWWSADKQAFDNHYDPDYAIYECACLAPKQINEMLAAERERIKSMVRRACDLGNIITPRQRDMIIAGVDSETAIRNLGDAP
ncbi:hypothetical protein WSS15_23240 [Acetobacter pasteurianus]|uniref:hypothetical protein n=1 Tax=Acetobacter pasteurianus TaxID=438 RepID=UPI0022CA85FD|nr:hypothetical protein [Acetobacter pasteurianus]GLH29674.1 hypothetical protein WSS15_23240 [Acetobacter pasteurianus]